MKHINIIDTTMRDGSHAIAHQYTETQVAAIAAGLENAGIGYVELSHGDGIAGSSINYGFSGTDEKLLLSAASRKLRKARLGVLILPGIGTIEDLDSCIEIGIDAVRVATHCTEADISIQHINHAKKKGLFTAGFLMMIHMADKKALLEQAKIMQDCGVDYINLADSAGHLLPDQARERIDYLVERINIPIGFHAHNNLGLAIANSIAAVEAGALYLDMTCRGLGAGAGNAQGEVLVAVLDMMGYSTGVDLYKIQDLSQNVVASIMNSPQIIDTTALMLGYAGVYSSFLLHTKRAAARFGISSRDILVELGKRKMVGGQEDMIMDVAYELSMKKNYEETD